MKTKTTEGLNGKKVRKKKNNSQDPEIREGVGAGLTWTGDMGQDQEKARGRKTAGMDMGYKL